VAVALVCEFFTIFIVLVTIPEPHCCEENILQLLHVHIVVFLLRVTLVLITVCLGNQVTK